MDGRPARAGKKRILFPMPDVREQRDRKPSFQSASPSPKSMTIAKRLIILLAVPLVALLGLGVFVRMQLSDVEDKSRFVAESRISALATIGNLTRSFAELRMDVRGYLLATN